MATRKYSHLELEAVKTWFENNTESKSERVINDLIQIIKSDYPAKGILATNSAMAALHIALQTIDAGPGDEIIVDPIVVFGGMAVMYNNAVPIFADIDLESHMISPSSIESRVTERTKAIIVTQLFGNIANMSKIIEIAKKHDLYVIEDCAQALFAKYDNKFAGLFGDFAAFSFNHRKQLSTGQGGFLLINNENLVEKALDKGFGRVPSRLTWNYTMSGIIAAIAIPQWDHAKEYVKNDHDLANLYNLAVSECEWLIPQKIESNVWTSYHIWSSRFEGDKHGIKYDEFVRVLKENGADYFLPSFIPYGVFGLKPSPAYMYPIFKEPKAYNFSCPLLCPHYSGKVFYDEGYCKNAEYLVPRLLNTVLSPVDDERVKKYAHGLFKTVKYFL